MKNQTNGNGLTRGQEENVNSTSPLTIANIFLSLSLSKRNKYSKMSFLKAAQFPWMYVCIFTGHPLVIVAMERNRVN